MGENMAEVGNNARAVLAWCAAHQSSATRLIRGRVCPTIMLDWNGLARAQGFENDAAPGATRSSLDALDVLRAAGAARAL